MGSTQLSQPMGCSSPSSCQKVFSSLWWSCPMATSTMNHAHLRLLPSCCRQPHSSAVHGQVEKSQHFHIDPYSATWAAPRPCHSFPLQGTTLQDSSLLCPSCVCSPFIHLCLKAQTPPPPEHSYPREQGYSLHPSPSASIPPSPAHCTRGGLQTPPCCSACWAQAGSLTLLFF